MMCVLGGCLKDGYKNNQNNKDNHGQSFKFTRHLQYLPQDLDAKKQAMSAAFDLKGHAFPHVFVKQEVPGRAFTLPWNLAGVAGIQHCDAGVATHGRQRSAEARAELLEPSVRFADSLPGTGNKLIRPDSSWFRSASVGRPSLCRAAVLRVLQQRHAERPQRDGDGDGLGRVGPTHRGWRRSHARKRPRLL